MYVPSCAVLQARAQCCFVTKPCCQVELGNAGAPTLRRQAPAESNFDGIPPTTHRETKRLCGVSRHVAVAGVCLAVVAVSVVLGVLLSLKPSKRYITQSTASQMPNAGMGTDPRRVSFRVFPAREPCALRALAARAKGRKRCSRHDARSPVNGMNDLGSTIPLTGPHTSLPAAAPATTPAAPAATPAPQLYTSSPTLPPAAPLPPVQYSFLPYWKVVARVKELAQQYPELVEVYTTRERFGLPTADTCQMDASGPLQACDVYVLHVGNKALRTETTPAVFFSGTLHGDERVGPTTTLEFATWLLQM